jgi:hypothetical protein
MFNKYNFEEKFILLIILVFAIASNYHIENSGEDIFFGKYLMSLSLLTIGIWGIFIENGIVNTSDQVQVTVVAAVTQYLLTTPFKSILGYSYRYHGVAAYLALILTSILLSFKYLTLVERFFRFTFAFTFSLLINYSIEYMMDFGYPIYTLIGIGAVFYKKLTLRRMSIVSSVYVFSRMIYLGFDTLMLYISDFNRTSPHFFDYYASINCVQFVIFIGASYFQLRNDSSNSEVLPRNVNNYSTFDNSEANNNVPNAQ